MKNAALKFFVLKDHISKCFRYDLLGLEMQSVHFGKYSDAQYHFETAFELFYRVNFSEWFSLKPDVQYIAHPGGKELKNAFAGILRMEIHL